MQRKIGNEVHIRDTVSPFGSIGKSSAIDRTVSEYENSREKVKKIRQLISTGTYCANIARYIPGMLDLMYKGIIADMIVHGAARLSDNADRQLLRKPKQHSPLFSYED